MSINHLIPPRTLGYSIVFLFFTALISACGPSANMNLTRMDKVMEMTKEPCYGRCPVFTLTIYSNGMASYKGEQNTDRLGTYVKKLDKTQLERLQREFESANVWQYRDFYQGRIPDMQTVKISYFSSSRKKTISGKEVRPNAVKWLESLLDQVAQSSEGWILKEAPQDNLPDFIISDELIVELEEGTDPEEWAKSYANANMALERQFSDAGYWVFSYDDELVTPEQMLEQVRMDEFVISAEYNKEIYEQLNGDEKDEKKPDKLPSAVRQEQD